MKRLVLIGAIALLVGGVAPAHAGKAFSAPTSDEVLEIDLTLPNGKVAKIRSREGTMITVEDESRPRSYKYAFISRLEPTREASFMVLSIAPLKGGGEDVTQKAMLQNLSLGSSVRVRPDDNPFEIKFSSVELGYFPALPPLPPEGELPSPSALREIYGKAGSGGDCCVRCYSITVCASSVTLDCGACTSGGAYAQ